MGEHEALKTYIENYWPKLKVENTLETKQRLGLPYPYYVPSTRTVNGFLFPHMFYWDTYFIAQGLWGSEREHEIVGLCENLFDLINRFGYVPNGNSFTHLAHSQPPLLSTLAMQVYNKFKQDDLGWLQMAYDRLVEEYRTCWIGTVQPHIRMVHQGLSRYYDPNFIDALAEAESGWDYTTRFDDKCLDYLPIDLNCYLFKYETDLATMAEILGHEPEAVQWHKASRQRQTTVNTLLWDEQTGLFYDYDYAKEQKGSIKTLAAYTALFSGLATQEQAEKLVANLPLFEFDNGLSCTAVEDTPTEHKQWTYPNGWAPLHDLVFEGLLRYGFKEEALRIASKWVHTVEANFESKDVLYEKYNVVHLHELPEHAIYPDQEGFGWTNAITYKFIRFLDSHASLKQN